jgi:hypothetical protein
MQPCFFFLSSSFLFCFALRASRVNDTVGLVMTHDLATQDKAPR